jgi:hypothetical protein
MMQDEMCSIAGSQRADDWIDPTGAEIIPQTRCGSSRVCSSFGSIRDGAAKKDSLFLDR